MENARLVPIGVMARRLRVPVAWLKQEAEANRIPSLRAGRAILVEPDAVMAALVERAKGVKNAE